MKKSRKKLLIVRTLFAKVNDEGEGVVSGFLFFGKI